MGRRLYPLTTLPTNTGGDVGCTEPMPGDWWDKGDDSIFIPTYNKEVMREQVSGTEKCKELALRCKKENQVILEGC